MEGLRHGREPGREARAEAAAVAAALEAEQRVVADVGPPPERGLVSYDDL